MVKPGNYTDNGADPAFHGMHYCDGKPTTGSVTIVDHNDGRGPIPTALFGCNGEEHTVIAKATPTDLKNDPMLTNWTMDPHNPVMRYPEGKGGRDPATAWRAPARATAAVKQQQQQQPEEEDAWYTISACGGNCSEEVGRYAAAALWSSADFEKWDFVGTLFGMSDPNTMVECPEFYNVTALAGSNESGTMGGEVLHMLKASYTHKEIAYVGRYDTTKQKLVRDEFIRPRPL